MLGAQAHNWHGQIQLASVIYLHSPAEYLYPERKGGEALKVFNWMFYQGGFGQ